MMTQPSIPELGPLIIPFPPRWTFEYPEQSPVEGCGPGSEFASISFSEASPQANEQKLRSHFDATVAFANDMLLAVAADVGTPRGEPSLLLEAGGRAIYSAASTIERGGVAGYHLQYLCVSLVSQHYIRVAGEGSIEEAIETWDDIMRRSTWANEALPRT